LLVIDAGEGARPQTHEHLAILRLLGVEHGVVAVTKADAVAPEVLDLAVAEARELVPDAEVVAVSAKVGAGLDELRAALSRAAGGLRRELPPRRRARGAGADPAAGHRPSRHVGLVRTRGARGQLRPAPAGLPCCGRTGRPGRAPRRDDGRRRPRDRSGAATP